MFPGRYIPFDVINGFYSRSDKGVAFTKLAVTQLPCGSGNALSLSTHGTDNAFVATVAAKVAAYETRLDGCYIGIGENATTGFVLVIMLWNDC